MDDTLRTVKEMNECQITYRDALKEARELASKIQRAILDMPAAAEGDWSLVGDAQHLRNELADLHKWLNGEG